MSRFQTRLQGEVLELIQATDCSILEMSKIIGSGYESTRNAVRALEHKGYVKPVNTGVYRNVKYTLGDPITTATNTIPEINGHKIIGLLKNRGLMEDSSASKAVLNLPWHITRIMNAANNLAAGKVVPQMTLQLVQDQMQKDLKNLQNLVKVYEEVLSDPRNWNEQMLRTYPDDAEWDQPDLEEAMKYYYPSA